jgi:hypothetical protein
MFNNFLIKNFNFKCSKYTELKTVVTNNVILNNNKDNENGKSSQLSPNNNSAELSELCFKRINWNNEQLNKCENLVYYDYKSEYDLNKSTQPSTNSDNSEWKNLSQLLINCSSNIKQFFIMK